ncbi:ABC transporter ATP-binding protein [Acrocarpospora catenulata]|uniref:ABC transporter ATP-binding protein n=1 Tax=Acrocarpospora catenulata TaxID=2836182 RepID=UPI001BD9FAF1|nr:ABC transporter ATP-binding protein [Acrocarpospora catenulata]
MSHNGSTAPGTQVDLQGISKRYGSFLALDDVSITIEPGEFVTLLGASGSGKTTLLRILAGFLQPTSGLITLDATDVTRVPVYKRNIGMVFQNYALFPHMNVEKNISFPLEMRKVPRARRDELITGALRAVHMEDFRRRLPRELSGGQQQRVALARAIVTKPSILLMDEPLGALDRRLRESMQIEILKLSRELGLTVVNVTHDQEEAFTMSDRIALLSHGRLVQYSTPAEMYEKPNSSLVAEFVGESNVFRSDELVTDRSRVEIKGDTWHVAAEDGLERLSPGDRPVVIVRPWSISLTDAADKTTVLAEGGRSHLEGTVSAVIYAGESRKIIVHGGGDDRRELIVRQPIETELNVAVGERVLAHWPSVKNLLTKEHAA